MVHRHFPLQKNENEIRKRRRDHPSAGFRDANCLCFFAPQGDVAFAFCLYCSILVAAVVVVVQVVQVVVVVMVFDGLNVCRLV